MIHRLIVIDRNKSVGSTIYDNGRLGLQSDLLIGLVQALMLLGNELGPAKGALREAELGKYQIGIISEDHLSYVIIQDTYDSEPFTSKILRNVIDEFHEDLLKENFNQELTNKEKIKPRAKELLETQKFPEKLIPKMHDMVKEFQIKTTAVSDTILLSDLDDGIVTIFDKDENDENIIKLLMEIQSEIPFERHWLGESKLLESKDMDGQEKQYEGWFIYRIGLTDFCLMGRAYYNPGEERDKLVTHLENLSIQSMNLILQSQEDTK